MRRRISDLGCAGDPNRGMRASPTEAEQFTAFGPQSLGTWTLCASEGISRSEKSGWSSACDLGSWGF